MQLSMKFVSYPCCPPDVRIYKFTVSIITEEKKTNKPENTRKTEHHTAIIVQQSIAHNYVDAITKLVTSKQIGTRISTHGLTYRYETEEFSFTQKQTSPLSNFQFF